MLTDEEIKGIGNQYEGDKNGVALWFARAIESAVLAKLREQNEPLFRVIGMSIYALKNKVLPQGTELFEHPAPIPESIQDFIYKFKRHVGGDGEFWLHELEDFYTNMAAARSE